MWLLLPHCFGTISCGELVAGHHPGLRLLAEHHSCRAVVATKLLLRNPVRGLSPVSVLPMHWTLLVVSVPPLSLFESNENSCETGFLVVGKDPGPIMPRLLCTDWIYFCLIQPFSREARKILLLNFFFISVETLMIIIIIIINIYHISA